MPRRAPVQATRDHLAAAAAHLRRPDWPAHLDDVLAHELFGPCVRGLARCLARGEPMPAGRPQPDELHRQARASHDHRGGAIAAPRPGQQAVPRLRFDPRRAAANDHDDTDTDAD
jgi:hypothetical protein